MIQKAVQHAWDVPIQEAIKIQNRLRQEIALENVLQNIQLVAVADMPLVSTPNRLLL